MSLKVILALLKSKSSESRRKTNEWFFKTGPGEYGEGDIFIGVSVPDSRAIAKKYFKDLLLKDVERLMESKIHEERLLGLHVLVLQYASAGARSAPGKSPSQNQKEIKNKKREIFRFYLENLKYVNNWDLVDTSAACIVGDYLYNFENKNFKLLKKLAKSKDLWEKRVGIIACYYFIKQKRYKEILEIGEIVKNDKHDLLQKAFGWMLREVYKNVNEGVVRKFLEENIKTLPRTTLRYAIEKMDLQERKIWLSK